MFSEQPQPPLQETNAPTENEIFQTVLGQESPEAAVAQSEAIVVLTAEQAEAINKVSKYFDTIKERSSNIPRQVTTSEVQL